MRKADGTYISVLDHGRIVDSVHNGRVFLCDNHGLKVTAETFWRLPEAGGEVEISLLSIIPYSFYQRFLFQITA